MQIITPQAVGMTNDSAVHFQLCVSFLMVNNDVAHGQCINENNIMLIAVIKVQPLSTSKVFNISKSFNSNILVPFI